MIDSIDTPGGCWVHFSAIAGDSDTIRSLTVGHTVEFVWDIADQDGFQYRATSVSASSDNGRHIEHGEEKPFAYGSTLTIEYDGGDAR